MISLTLTKAEADQAGWALDPMTDHASDNPEESRYSPTAVPSLDGLNLSFPTDDRAVPLDMLYRLEVQLLEMAQAEGAKLPPGTRSLARKIRTAFAVTEDESRAVVRGEV
jgi:hypothetical protein